MAKENLSGLRVAILVTNGFEQVELTEPRKALEEAGAQVKILAPEAGEVYGMNHDQKADKFKVDMLLSEAKPEDFDAVLLPGGTFNADQLRSDANAQQFVRIFDALAKPIAFICHAPWLLVSANIVEGRSLTSFNTLQDDIRKAGGNWKDEKVVVDGNWVSSRQPDDIPAFNQEMLALFGEYLHNHKDKMDGRGTPYVVGDVSEAVEIIQPSGLKGDERRTTDEPVLVAAQPATHEPIRRTDAGNMTIGAQPIDRSQRDHEKASAPLQQREELQPSQPSGSDVSYVPSGNPAVSRNDSSASGQAVRLQAGGGAVRSEGDKERQSIQDDGHTRIETRGPETGQPEYDVVHNDEAVPEYRDETYRERDQNLIEGQLDPRDQYEGSSTDSPRRGSDFAR